MKHSPAKSRSAKGGKLSKTRANLTAVLTGLKAQVAAPKAAPLNLSALLGECRDMLAGNPSPEAIDTVRAMLASAQSSHAGLVAALQGVIEHFNWDTSGGPEQAAYDTAIAALKAAQPNA